MTLPYPLTAGHQGGDTDIEASDAIEDSGKAETLRKQVLKLMKRHQLGLTADEAAHHMDVDILSIRPRFTELKLRGYLVDTGWRRPSQNGKMQRVLKLNHDPQNSLGI